MSVTLSGAIFCVFPFCFVIADVSVLLIFVVTFNESLQ